MSTSKQAILLFVVMTRLNIAKIVRSNLYIQESVKEAKTGVMNELTNIFKALTLLQKAGERHE